MTDVVRADIAIVGAGLGGLSAARHLQDDGYRVVVLEAHSKPGGYAHFFRKDDFRFEVALHALDGLGPRGWARPMFETLGILDRVEFNPLDPFYTVRFPDFEASIPADLDGHLAELSRLFPDERDGARELFAAIRRVGHDAAAFARDRSTGVRVPPHEVPSRYPDMALAFASTWESFIGPHLASAEARAFVSTLWGYLGLPPSRVSAGQMALTILSYGTGGAWYPTGGSGTMTWAIADVIAEHGGEVHLRSTVTDIEPTTEGFTVHTRSGPEVRARAVVSNASPSATVSMLPDGVIDESWLREVDAETPSLSSLVVHLGLDIDLAATGWPYHEFFDMVGYDLDAEYEAVRAGRFDQAGMILSNYTVVDPTCAPSGGSVLVLTTLAPWDHADIWGTGGDLDDYRVNPAYQRVKDEAGGVLIERAARLIPGLRESIVTAHVGTPLTNVRYVRQPRGSLYGREQDVTNMMHRRRPTTPVSGLFLAGAWVGGGGMTAAVGSGRSAARAAHRYLAGDSDR